MKYVIEISASFNNKIIDLTDYIASIVIHSDYVENIMPMWAFSFNMPYEIKKQLQEEDFTLPFRIYSILASGEEGSDPYSKNEDIIYNELIYEDEIIEYEKSRTNTKTITDEEQENNTIKTDLFTVTGLSKAITEINSSVLNGNYRNTSSVNAIKAAVQDLSNRINIITSENVLTKEYNQVIIPPMNLIPAIRHIIRNYPLYTSTTGIFFTDKQNLHIFTDTFDTLTTRIDIEIIESSQEIGYDPNDFILKKIEDGYYTYKTQNTPPYTNIKKVSDNLLGIEKIIYSYDELFDTRTGSVQDDTNIYEKKRIYWDNLGEDSTTSIISDRYKRNRSTAISFGGVDSRIFNQYTYVNLEGVEGVDYLKGMYVVKSKTEMFTSSESNNRILKNEITIQLENVVE